MRLFTPGQSKRLNEVTGFVFLAAGILFLLSMASFHPQDPSWDTAAGAVRTSNLIGPVGAHVADLFLQSFGLAAFLFPLLIFALGWKWIRSEALEAPAHQNARQRACWWLPPAARRRLLPDWRLFDHTILPGGAAGFLIADSLKHALNPAGAAVVLATALVVSTYLVSTFTLAKLRGWFAPLFDVFARIAGQMAPVRWNAAAKTRCRRLEEKRQAAAYEASETSHATLRCPIPPTTQQRTRRRDTRARHRNPALGGAPCAAGGSGRKFESHKPQFDNGEIPICQLAETPPPAPRTWSSFPSANPSRRKRLQSGTPSTVCPPPIC